MRRALNLRTHVHGNDLSCIRWNIPYNKAFGCLTPRLQATLRLLFCISFSSLAKIYLRFIQSLGSLKKRELSRSLMQSQQI